MDMPYELDDRRVNLDLRSINLFLYRDMYFVDVK